MYPYELMPDPDATKRLTKHGIKCSFKEDHYLKPAKLVHPEDAEPRANEEKLTDGGQMKPSEGKRRAKLIKLPCWLVKIEIPRHFIDEFLADTAGTSGDEDVELEDVKDAYDGICICSHHALESAPVMGLSDFLFSSMTLTSFLAEKPLRIKSV